VQFLARTPTFLVNPVDPAHCRSSFPRATTRDQSRRILTNPGATIMQFIPYLDFDGQCREAFDFYATVFNGKITMRMTFGESPMASEMPVEAHDRVMHSQLESAGGILMGADGPPHSASRRSCVSLPVDTPTEAERIFNALAAGGEVQMPIQETFWAERFGMLTDRYGKAWMVNCAKA
jgi:PhnB protein